MTRHTIWFRHSNQLQDMFVEVEVINGDLRNAQEVWDTLALSFHMVNTRP